MTWKLISPRVSDPRERAGAGRRKWEREHKAEVTMFLMTWARSDVLSLPPCSSVCFDMRRACPQEWIPGGRDHEVSSWRLVNTRGYINTLSQKWWGPLTIGIAVEEGSREWIDKYLGHSISGPWWLGRYGRERRKNERQPQILACVPE